MFEGDYCPNCDNYIKELEELLALSHRKRDQYREQVERLEKAGRIADQKARQAGKARITEELRAALEGKQGGVEKERCPHLAGDLCVKEGACECYGAEQDG